MAKAKGTSSGEVNFSNLEKVFFPKGQFTKGEVIKYYIDVAPYLLPHFRDRPVTLIRFPDGVNGEKFFEKNAPAFAPDWIRTTHVRRSRGGFINYILINDARTLAWCANLAAIELHPFLHRADATDRPTHIAFDLDPGEGADLRDCIEVGFLLKELLAGLRLEAFPKVTGSKGLQLYVPLNTPVTYDAVTPFAKTVAELLHREHPDMIVSDMAKKLRVKRVFIDWSQNHEKKTTVGPYSMRGKHPEPFISMPVAWAELAKARKSRDIEALYFSPADALKRLRRRGDLFAPVLELKQRLPTDFVGATAGSSPRAPAALSRYAAKRDFRKTSEPTPALPTRSRHGSRRRFVIQKHAASHLHYDLRLEMDGTLKSWAVPKGLSPELGVKRSAFQTEDHPLEYLDFEGTIPEGQYGGGTVMVWDIGTYEVLGGDFWKGDLKLFLDGRKLKGEWHIFRIKSEDEKPIWLIQKAGQPAKPVTTAQDDRSILSRRTMKQISTAGDAVWQSNRPPSTALSKMKARRAESTAPSTTAAPKRGRVPRFDVMTARAVKELPTGADWNYEIKLEGYRTLGLKTRDSVRLLSRHHQDITEDFPDVARAVATIRAERVLLDGEVVELDAAGRPSKPSATSPRAKGGNIVYYAFDLLHLDGEDWRDRPLVQRKAKLAEIIDGSAVRLSASFGGPPGPIVEQARRLGLGGVIAKRQDASYGRDGNTRAWLSLDVRTKSRRRVARKPD